MSRPTHEDHYLAMAIVCSWRACCTGSKVGAVMVKEDHVLATGFNGTPHDWPNCGTPRSCPRCELRLKRPELAKGSDLDLCVCVHAEANAIAMAARFGIALEGADVYVTHAPCLDCAKELVQVGAHKVHYLKEYELKHEDPGLQEEARNAHAQLLRVLRAEKHDMQRIGSHLVEWIQRSILVPSLPEASVSHGG